MTALKETAAEEKKQDWQRAYNRYSGIPQLIQLKGKGLELGS